MSVLMYPQVLKEPISLLPKKVTDVLYFLCSPFGSNWKDITDLNYYVQLLDQLLAVQGTHEEDEVCNCLEEESVLHY